MGHSIRVLIAEDEPMFRRALADLVGLAPELDLLSACANGERAFAEAMVLRPDVVLTDLQMPLMGGEDLIRRLAEKLPACRVLVLSKFGDDESVFGALKAGAHGYLLKDAGLDTLVEAVRSVHEGQTMLSPGLVGRVLGEFRRLSASALHNRKLFEELSRREVEILECLAAGMKNLEIADRFSLSEKTVKTHVGSILRKLHVNDRLEAAELARKSGIEPAR